MSSRRKALPCASCLAICTCCSILVQAAVATAAAAAAAGSPGNHGEPRPLLTIQAKLGNTSYACATAKPTIVLLSGVGGSQMSGTFTGNAQCPPLVNETVIWYADKWALSRSLACWSHHMSLNFDAASGRWTNSSGTQLWPDYGKVFGQFPDKSKQKMFYAFLLKHLFEKHGYVPGADLFNIPFDWRIGIQGLEHTGGLQRIVDDISRAVQKNCGQRAIVISHSYGANVMATIFQKPEFETWRRATVSGWIPVGGPFGGAAVTAWLTMLSGDFFKLFPLASNLLKPQTTGKWKPTVVGRSVYHFAFGLPSWGWMLPREGVLGVNQTVIVTPSRNYTVLEQKQLLLDMGDVAGAALLDDSWQRSEQILRHGPIPGLETYCFYSTGVVTPETLIFNESVPRRQAMARPADIIWTSGDGVVDLNSLRLCGKLAPAGHVVEVHAPLVDHASILSHPLGLAKLSAILHKLGVPAPSGPLKGPLSLLERALAGRRRR